MVKKSCVIFSLPYVDSDLEYWYIIWKVKTRNGNKFEKHLLHYVSEGWDFIHAKPVFFFNIFSVDPHADSLIIGLYLTCLITGQTFGEGTV